MAGSIGRRGIPLELKARQIRARENDRNSVSLVDEMLDIQGDKVFTGFQEYPLRNMTPEQAASEIGNAIISLCELADSLDHMLSEDGSGTPEIQSAFAQIRQSVPVEIFTQPGQAE